MQASEKGTYIEFVKWLLQVSEEPPCLGDFIINGKCSIKNRSLGVFEAGWRRGFSHGCKSRIL
jgi:hypothetical protein